MKKNILIFIYLLLSSLVIKSQIVMTWQETGTYSSSIPVESTMIIGEVWGAGGGGGGARAMLSATACGGGAGGGAFATGEFPSALNSCVVVVGKGGNGGIEDNDGEEGGCSKISFGNEEITANGGGAGAGKNRNTASTEANSVGDFGLGGSFAFSQEIINNSGINGEDGSLGYFSYSFPVWHGVGGSGGSGAGVGGGAGGTCNVDDNGGNGYFIGGGGAGGALYKTGGADTRNGGNGANGKAVLKFSLPKPSFNFISQNICQGDSATILISDNYSENANYKLIFNENEIYSFTSQSFTFMPTTTGNYKIYACYSNFYSDSDTVYCSSEYEIAENYIIVKNDTSITLNINPNPNILSINASYDFDNQGIASVEVISDNINDSYYWNNGSEEAFLENLFAGEYCVSVVNQYGCSTSDCVTVISNTITEISEENIEFNFSIFPNPNDGNFTIELDNFEENIKYQIININAIILAEGQLEAGKTEHNISTKLLPGTYILRLITDKKNYSQTMIVR